MKWTKRVVAGDADAAKVPKHWCNGDQHRETGSALVSAVQVSRDREVLGPEDFTEADIEAIRRARPSPESAAFDHELTEDQQ
ncbi:MAG: hypothetical protein WBO09_22490 [Methylocystis silviterrae]|uniref:hypothetical protein n=1 Tax=Methylocystis silviterrae TaxID=2743612 RepID=UPI003C743537